MEKMLHNSAFRINTPRVVHQTIDGETIIIDFDNGAYFSIAGVGAVIWEQIAQNASVNDIVHALTQRYAGDHSDIETEVERFLSELQCEALIAPLDRAPSAPRRATPAMPDPNLASLPAFQAPSLHKYTDMQDLLLLDPIHEVDEQGWPIRKDATSG
ncbi:MAG: PqqD family protein [Chloroflexi bacterium]|nr:PqqD family protein [Chloroflexota bacterium]